MNEIFLSYRRDDTQTETLLLFEHLARRFGAEHVFQDQGIPPGSDFRAVLDERLRQCRILLVIVGPRWLDSPNKQRLHDASDWVRRELESAVKAGKLIVPVFVNGAKPPRAEDLPEGPLRDRFWAQQGGFVRADNYFASDMALVRERIAQHTGLAPREGDDGAWTYAPLPPPALCVGRNAQHAALVDQLLAESCQPILVQGGPGFGKTTLAVDALRDPRVQSRYTGRCFFVRCDAARSSSALMDLLAGTFQIAQAQDREAALLRRLQQLAPLVLILDNAETPWYGQRRACEDIFAQLSAVHLCRLVLTVRGKERPVGLAWQTPIEVNRLVPPFDRRLFLEHAGQQFAADAALDRLLAVLAGWPLPTRLLAQQAQDYSDLTELERRWKKEKEGLLKIEGREDDAHSNFEASVELSIASSRVDEPGRRLLALLGMLSDGVRRDDLDALLPERGDAAASTLRKAGLAFDDGTRLRVHPFLRDYLNRRHPPNEEGRARVLAFYVGVAREGEQAGTGTGAAAIQHVTQELANVLFAVEANLADEDPTAGIEAGIALTEFVRFTGLQEPMIVLATAEARTRTGTNRRYQAKLIDRLGNIALDRSQHNEARGYYEEALLLYQQLTNVPGEAHCISRLGDIALRGSRLEEARSRYEQALLLHRRPPGSILGEAYCIERLGDIALARSRPEEAQSRYTQALPLFRQVGSVLGEAYCIMGLGNIALVRLQYGETRSRCEQALPLYRQAGSDLGVAYCIKVLGEIAVARSEHEVARKRYEEALALYRLVGAVLGEANCIQSLGDIERDQGNQAAARQHYLGALELYARIAEPYSIGSSHDRLARVADSEDERRQHVAAARVAWQSIDRSDLIQDLDREFGA